MTKRLEWNLGGETGSITLWPNVSHDMAEYVVEKMRALAEEKEIDRSKHPAVQPDISGVKTETKNKSHALAKTSSNLVQ